MKPSVLRDLRKKSGKSVIDVAKRLAVSPITMYQYEQGKATMPVKHVLEFADYCNVPIETVVYAAINRTPPAHN